MSAAPTAQIQRIGRRASPSRGEDHRRRLECRRSRRRPRFRRHVGPDAPEQDFVDPRHQRRRRRGRPARDTSANVCLQSRPAIPPRSSRRNLVIAVLGRNGETSTRISRKRVRRRAAPPRPSTAAGSGRQRGQAPTERRGASNGDSPMSILLRRRRRRGAARSLIYRRLSRSRSSCRRRACSLPRYRRPSCRSARARSAR